MKLKRNKTTAKINKSKPIPDDSISNDIPDDSISNDIVLGKDIIQHIRMRSTLYESIQVIARKEERTISAQIRFMIGYYILLKQREDNPILYSKPDSV